MTLEMYPCKGENTTARIVRGTSPEMWSLSVRIIADADLIRDRSEQQAVIKMALDQDPGCIFTHNLLAKLATNPQEKIRHYVQAVRSGQELWDPVIKEMGAKLDIHVAPTLKPYVTALFFLGETLRETYDFTGAKGACEEVLKFMPEHRTAAERLQMIQEVEVRTHQSPAMVM